MQLAAGFTTRTTSSAGASGTRNARPSLPGCTKGKSWFYFSHWTHWDDTPPQLGEQGEHRLTIQTRFKAEMWQKVAKEVGVPWRAAEAMHWQLGEADIARRVGAEIFTLSGPGTTVYIQSNSPPLPLPSAHQIGGGGNTLATQERLPDPRGACRPLLAPPLPPDCVPKFTAHQATPPGLAPIHKGAPPALALLHSQARGAVHTSCALPLPRVTEPITGANPSRTPATRKPSAVEASPQQQTLHRAIYPPAPPRPPLPALAQSPAHTTTTSTPSTCPPCQK